MAGDLVVFRTDGGAAIGGGHVARCLTLAGELARRGWRGGFAVSRDTATAMRSLAASGHEILVLPSPQGAGSEAVALERHWPEGRATLVVDHYGLDAGAESACRGWAERIVVLDDLADRRHDCDLLLDPTLGRTERDYRALVPQSCRLLLGPDFALLRPEFASLRPAALDRRRAPALRRLLISFGSTDPANATASCLDALARAGLDLAVDVALGAAAPHLEEVRARAAKLAGARLHVEAGSMAELMEQADCALGGAGATSWERCCMGLPSVVAVLADNQRAIAWSLSDAGAALVAGDWRPGLAGTLVGELASLDTARLARMARAAASICDGSGTFRAANAIEGLRGDAS